MDPFAAEWDAQELCIRYPSGPATMNATANGQWRSPVLRGFRFPKAALNLPGSLFSRRSLICLRYTPVPSTYRPRPGRSRVNGVADRVRAELLRNVQLADLLRPSPTKVPTQKAS